MKRKNTITVRIITAQQIRMQQVVFTVGHVPAVMTSLMIAATVATCAVMNMTVTISALWQKLMAKFS